MPKLSRIIAKEIVQLSILYTEYVERQAYKKAEYIRKLIEELNSDE